MSDIKSLMLPSEVNLDEYNANSVPQEARVDTQYLLPNQINDNSCRFVLNNAGILDMKNTKIVLQANCSSANDLHVAYPMGTGVAALIDRAILRFGSKVACTSSNFGHYFNIVNWAFTSTDTKQNIDHYTYLTDNAFGVVADATDSVWDGVGWLGANLSSAADSNSGGLSQIASLSNAGSNGSIPLSVLFPGFVSTDLPMYLIRDEVTVEIVWKQENGLPGARAIVTDDSGSFTLTDPNPIDQSEIMLICDHVFFSNQRMNAIEDNFRQNGFNAFYSDIQSTNNILADATSTNSSRLNFKIGGAGKTIQSFVASNNASLNTAAVYRYAFGEYNSVACEDSKGFQITINNQNQLGIDPQNMNYAMMNNLLGSLYGNNYPEVPYSLYNELQPEGITDRTWNGQASYANMKGHQSAIGMRFDDIKCRNIPIDLELFRLSSTSGLVASNLYTFITVKRMFSIDQAGRVAVSYS